MTSTSTPYPVAWGDQDFPYLVSVSADEPPVATWHPLTVFTRDDEAVHASLDAPGHPPRMLSAPHVVADDPRNLYHWIVAASAAYDVCGEPGCERRDIIWGACPEHSRLADDQADTDGYPAPETGAPPAVTDAGGAPPGGTS